MSTEAPTSEPYQMCPKCGELQPPTSFGGFKLCGDCRRYAREAMRLHHYRRRNGIGVTRGRPRIDQADDVVRIQVTIPRARQAELEALVVSWIREHEGQFGQVPEVGTHLSTPRAPDTKPVVTRSSRKGATRSPEDQEFLQSVAPQFNAQLQECSAVIFNMRKRQWEAAGKPENWSPPSKRQAGTAPSSTADQPTDDQNG